MGHSSSSDEWICTNRASGKSPDRQLSNGGILVVADDSLGVLHRIRDGDLLGIWVVLCVPSAFDFFVFLLVVRRGKECTTGAESITC